MAVTPFGVDKKGLLFSSFLFYFTKLKGGFCVSGEKYNPYKEFGTKEKAKRTVFDWVSTLAESIFLVVIVFTFVCRFVTVDGESMMQTLSNGDKLIISDLNYTPERGDIVVIHDTEEEKFSGPIIKRVIATGGETVTVDYGAKKIYVTLANGEKYELEENYINTGSCTYSGRYFTNCIHNWPDPAYYMKLTEKQNESLVVDFEVPAGYVFVCGDNRAHSLDSRYVGIIDERLILGKVLFRLFPNPGVLNHTDYEAVGNKLAAKK